MPGTVGATRHFLLEIGTEELPPGELVTLSSALALALAENFANAGLEHSGAVHFESPRRMAVYIDALAAEQADSVKETLGPPLGDEKARLGFARRCGADPDALQRVETERGARWALREQRAGQTASTLAPALVESALSALPAGRRMRWGERERAFVRPVHWLVMLLDDEVLPCALFGVSSGRNTRGHRVHADRWVALTHAAEYLDTLREQGHVLACSAERKAVIQKQVSALDASHDGEADIDPDSLSEVAALVEWPVALTGRFDQRFLALPEVVLSTVMRRHQKYFPVRDANGSLLARFVTVANMESRAPERIVAGNERVLRPRLADAEFFLQADSQRSLAGHRDSLHGAVFHAKLGSMHQKSQRLGALSAQLADMLGAKPDVARRSGELAKADLSTLMVQELPETQGSMGGHYAKISGEEDAVAEAIAEHYHPRFANDTLPVTPIGQAVSLADRMDTLIGILGAGDAPSGSGDPFALRRAALGVLRIAIEAEHDLDLRVLCELAASHYRNIAWEAEPVAAALAFFASRSRSHFQERGFATELFLAAAGQAGHRPLDAQRRLVALRDFVALPGADAVVASNKRMANILRSVDQPRDRNPADARLPESWEDAPCDAEEQRLRKALASLGGTLPESLRRADYHDALVQLANLNEPLNRFFDHVLVMEKNAAARRNRLALLSGLHAMFSRMADFSALSPLTSDSAADAPR